MDDTFGLALSRYGRAVYSSSLEGAVSSFAVEQPAYRTAPETTLGNHPRKKTTSRKAKFTFSANEAASLRCKVDKKPFKPCKTPFKVKVKKLGKHKLSVVAVDAVGNTDATPATYKWKVLARKPHS